MSLKLNYDDDIRMLRESAGGFFADGEGAKALRSKRDARDFAALARGSGWKVCESWTDDAKMFSVHALVAEG